MASWKTKWDIKNKDTMVSEKNTALAEFSVSDFNASVKHKEFRNPNTKLPEKIIQNFAGVFSANAAYLKPTFVKMLNKIASQSM